LVDGQRAGNQSHGNPGCAYPVLLHCIVPAPSFMRPVAWLNRAHCPPIGALGEG
jgi:hypothetical protein